MNSISPEYYKVFIDLQQKEAQLNWTRNNYFLVTSSFLLLALSQLNFPVTTFLSGAGIAINIIWLFIQHRSNKYTGYYKKKADEIKPADAPEVYPSNLGGFQMRYLVYFLPISFILIWSLVIIGDLSLFISNLLK